MFRKEDNDARIENLRVARWERAALEKADIRVTDAEYARNASPYGWMDFAARAVHDVGRGGYGVFTDDAAVRCVVMDDEYLKWADDANLDPGDVRTQNEYVLNFPGADRDGAERMKKARLNISEWDYAISTAAPVAAGAHDARVSEEARSALRDYMTDLINDPAFTVYVGGYVIAMDAFHDDAERLRDMAHAALDDKTAVRYAGYETLTVAEEDSDMPVCIPVTVRETHDGTDLTLSEIRSYIDPWTYPPEKAGRTLWLPGERGYAPFNDINETAAGRLIRDAFAAAGASDAEAVLVPRFMVEQVARDAESGRKRRWRTR